MPRPIVATAAAVAVFGLSSACAGPYFYEAGGGGAARPQVPEASAAAPRAVRPRILSARVERYDDPHARGRDRLVVVFSEPLDPLTVVASAFGVARGDGTLAEISDATLWPANARDELRTVWLAVELGVAGDPPPLSVGVLGRVHSARGNDLHGVTATIAPATEPVTLVQALRLDRGGCEAGDHGVRTLWSSRVSAAQLPAGVEIVSGDGQRLEVTDVLDLDEDNVIDLCVSGAAAPSAVQIEEGWVRDLEGRAAAGSGTVLIDA